jgi:hypothetical protein
MSDASRWPIYGTRPASLGCKKEYVKAPLQDFCCAATLMDRFPSFRSPPVPVALGFDFGRFALLWRVDLFCQGCLLCRALHS